MGVTLGFHPSKIDLMATLCPVYLISESLSVNDFPPGDCWESGALQQV